MRRLCLGLVITYGVMFAVGYTAAKIAISTRTDDKRPAEFYVTATVPAVTAEARWVEVYVCSAEIDEDSGARCDFRWERRSLQETRTDQRQYIFMYRHVPRGTLLIMAAVADANWKTLATGQRTVLR